MFVAKIWKASIGSSGLAGIFDTEKSISKGLTSLQVPWRTAGIFVIVADVHG